MVALQRDDVMSADMDLKKTSLYALHLELGARMAPFGGWNMPLRYSGIIKEHEACRSAAALFDTDHMGELSVDGETALSDLENLLSCDLDDMNRGQCRYGVMCNDAGGVVDDLLVYRLGDCEFMLVVNAGTKPNDIEWISTHLSPTTTLRDRSDHTAKIDLQGPASAKIIERLIEDSIRELRFFRFMNSRHMGSAVIISRTGYTGEMGFEIYMDKAHAAPFWQECMRLGAVPAGLGARDTLRLEMGLPLYGHELSYDRNAGESGFDRSFSLNKSYIGSAVVTDKSRRSSALVAIQLSGRRAARSGDQILDVSGNLRGSVTSGSFAPSVGRAVALGYIQERCAVVGTSVKIKSPRYELEGEIVETPFYKQATGRRETADFL